MDRKTQQDQWLDGLLAKPATVADRGFAGAVDFRLKQQVRIRRQVFTGMVLGWLALVLLVVPLEDLTGDFQQLLVIGSEIRKLASALLEFDVSRDVLGTTSLLPVVIAALAVSALSALQLKN